MGMDSAPADADVASDVAGGWDSAEVPGACKAAAPGGFELLEEGAVATTSEEEAEEAAAAAAAAAGAAGLEEDLTPPPRTVIPAARELRAKPLEGAGEIDGV